MLRFTLLVLVLFVAAFISQQQVNADGIQFSRTVETVGPNGGGTLKFDSGCSSVDQYGSNNCNWAWGTTILGSVDAHSGPLNEGSTLVVDLKVDRVISWKFTCAACGANCTTSIPVVNEEVNFAMPPCPIPAETIVEAFNSTLPATSPTKGVKVTATGSISFLNENGATVLGLDIDATVQ